MFIVCLFAKFYVVFMIIFAFFPMVITWIFSHHFGIYFTKFANWLDEKITKMAKNLDDIWQL